jgi:hypothetical protein
VILTEQPGAASWPITAASFILMHTVPQDAANSRGRPREPHGPIRAGDG